MSLGFYGEFCPSLAGLSRVGSGGILDSSGDLGGSCRDLRVLFYEMFRKVSVGGLQFFS